MTTGNVVDLAARRAVQPAEGEHPPAPDDQGTCRQCGGWWFVLLRRATDSEHVPEHGAVTIDKHGGIRGYVGEPVCSDCGTPWAPRGGWQFH